MDKNESMPEEKKTQSTKDSAETKKKIGLIALILLLMVISAGAVFLWKNNEYKDVKKKKDAEIAALQKAKDDLQKQLTAAKETAASTITPATPCTAKAPSASAIESIQDSIKSRNTAALEGYMAPTVKVIIAASGGVGDRTPTQAVSDISSYISSSTDPWNFALAKAETDGYAKGFYGKYFPSIAVVGKSANGIVISFSFDCNGKINTVFMAAKGTL